MHSTKHANWLIALIIIIGFLLRLYTSLDFQLHVWDEKYHALVAKNLSKHPFTPALYDDPVLPYQSNDWTSNHIWLSKPPLPLWFMSASIKTFGTNEFAVRIPSLLLATLSIFLTYLIALNLFEKRTALLAAFFHSIHGKLIEMAAGVISSDHVETAFVFFVELSVLTAILSVRKKNQMLWSSLIGLTMGLAIMCKWLPALIVVPLWLYLWSRHEEKHSWKNLLTNLTTIVVSALTVSLPWNIYIWREFPAEASDMFRSLISPMTTVVHEHSGDALYYLDEIRIVFGDIIYIPMLWLIYKMMKSRNDRSMFFIGLWILIPLLVFSIAETKRATYLMISAPAYFILTASFFYYCYDLFKEKKYKFISAIIMVLLIAFPLRYSAERIESFQEGRNPEWSKEIKQLKNLTEENKVVLFGVEHSIETMFYTDYVVYSFVPDNETIKQVMNDGYKVYINHPNDEMKSIEGVEFLDLKWN